MIEINALNLSHYSTENNPHFFGIHDILEIDLLKGVGLSAMRPRTIQVISIILSLAMIVTLLPLAFSIF